MPTKPTPKGEANKTATDRAARDATGGEHTPVPATQDSGGDGRDTAPSEGGTAQGVPTGKLDQDHDGTAETPEVGQAHVASTARVPRQAPQNAAVPQPRDNPLAFNDRESEMDEPKIGTPPPKGDEGKTDTKSTANPDRRAGGGAGMKEVAKRAGTSAAAVEERAAAFEAACEIVGRGIKKLTEAGVGGGEAGKLAMEIWREMD